MICFGILFIYFGIKKKYEPFLLIPLGIGCILVNIPGTGLMDKDGLLGFNYMGVQKVIYPPLIFLGVGAITDFGPLIANPSTIILGAAAHIGIFIALLGAKIIGFSIAEAGAIGIIGGADGPMAIYVSTKLAPHLLGQVAVSAYSYMALLPLIQPPLMKLLIPPKERECLMEQMRPVSQKEKIIFPILMILLVNSLLPPIAPLISCLMLGNLIRESMVLNRIANTIGETFLDIVTVFIAVAIGSTMSAENFVNVKTLEIVTLGLIAFCTGTCGGILWGRLMYKMSKGKINPLIGSAGIAAVPMAARVSHKVGVECNPFNFLIMHAMGPNVAGVLGTAVAGGIMLTLLGVK
ncbi:sodium ion-translocating decarboxylase subunit beta [Pelotomaculum isophthalicicum JI]|uniref:Sodium ion-translocating decarboxylase subunit beta n=1 Tax=Pelotomaculum isophthalicicum JI TaxID=947010 RepID=A0A9X4JWS7_9FIRM|nr:sodium ion-translocating decarboxylase subunit beta [Pelotomaculum isophthalicicum]MDF9409883.1 sodium ion-translocating decarboxylase subunit beta [Pelotomaculum isophthalicicum JI]